MAKIYPIRKFSYMHWDVLALIDAVGYWDSQTPSPDWVFRGKAMLEALYAKAFEEQTRELVRSKYRRLKEDFRDCA